MKASTVHSTIASDKLIAFSILSLGENSRAEGGKTVARAAGPMTHVKATATRRRADRNCRRLPSSWTPSNPLTITPPPRPPIGKQTRARRPGRLGIRLREAHLASLPPSVEHSTPRHVVD